MQSSSLLAEEFYKAKESAPNFHTTLEAIRLLRSTVTDNNPNDSAFLITNGVSTSAKTKTGWSFNGKASSAHKKATEVLMHSFIRVGIIQLFISGSQASGFNPKDPSYLGHLKTAVDNNDHELSAFLISAGVNPRAEIDSTPAPKWSFAHNATPEHKKNTHDALALLPYRQYISRQHGDKIAASLIVKTDEAIAPSSHLVPDLTSSEEEPHQAKPSTVVADFSASLRSIVKHKTYKHLWPIFKLLGLAVQGLHREALLGTEKKHSDHRLLLYIDPQNPSTADFEIGAIGTSCEGENGGLHTYLRKEILLGGTSSDALFMTFIHEATHFAISEIYANDCSLPYVGVKTVDIGGVKKLSLNPTNIQEFNQAITQPLMALPDATLSDLSKYLSRYKKIYEKTPHYQQDSEIFSYFVQAVFLGEIDPDKILAQPTHPLYQLCYNYQEKVFTPAINHYRLLCSEAIKKRAEILNLSPAGKTGQPQVSDEIFGIRLATLSYFDDIDAPEFSTYEPSSPAEVHTATSVSEATSSMARAGSSESDSLAARALKAQQLPWGKKEFHDADHRPKY